MNIEYYDQVYHLLTADERNALDAQLAVIQQASENYDTQSILANGASLNALFNVTVKPLSQGSVMP